MKFLLVFAILAITVFAQDDYGEKKFAKQLLEDCEHLNQIALGLIEEYERHEKGHLLETVKHEAGMVKPLIDELKDDSEKTDSLKHLARLHVIEERTLYLENRIDEEIEIVQEITFDYKNRQMTVKQVAERTKILIREVSEALEENQVTRRNREPVQFELELLNKMIRRLEYEDPTTIAVTDEERLARIEKSLYQLIKHLKPLPTPTTPVPTTTVPPTTEPPTTKPPTTEPPTTVPPTTEPPTTEPPTTVPPTTEPPTTEPPTTVPPTTEPPTTEPPTTVPPTTEPPTTNQNHQLRRFANSEQMIQKLSESYPIRRSAQMMAYFYHRTKGTIESGSIQGKLPPINNRILTFKNRFMNEFRQEMQNSKNKIKR
ncbi:hypothetical protein HUG17_10153 [Dermatophagoides farinae]|uniref:Uncharacterized protein n=1 Tax=Dermatophagoides farinae TaxID=6954 RepID=A0A9D4NPY7_DERFA|nr:hypothetical protein HUG17_10153 [Dermatophagoides farinae]